MLVKKKNKGDKRNTKEIKGILPQLYVTMVVMGYNQRQVLQCIEVLVV